MLQEVWFELFYNDQYVVVFYGYVKGYYVDFGNFVVFYFKKWDIVKVKVRLGFDVRLYGNYDEFYIMFCGVFLVFFIYGVGSSMLV